MVKEPLSSKGKAEMGRVRDEDDAAASVPWSQEVLNKRIDYFNNVTSVSETPDSGRSEESRKLRHFKKKFLKVSGSSKGQATYNSLSTNSQKSTYSNSGGVERSTCGLVQLATPDRVDCSHDNSPTSPYRIFGGGCNAMTGDTSLVPQVVQNFITKRFEAPDSTPSIVNRLHSGNGPEGDAAAIRHPACEKKLSNEVEATTGAASSVKAELLQIPTSSAALGHHG